MPLTPEDVQKKTFTPVRLREGYDMGEVDQFLDEVEAELRSLHEEIDGLRGRLDAPAGASAPPTLTKPGDTDDAAPAAVAVPDTEAEPPPRSVPEAASAAARLLELATNSAEQLVAEAQGNADEILGAARSEAERHENETLARAEELESAAQTRSQSLDAETDERRQQMLSTLEGEKDTLSQELEELRAFEREYRTRLRAYFESQLRALDGAADTAETSAPLSLSTDEEVPRRLRELLGDDA